MKKLLIFPLTVMLIYHTEPYIYMHCDVSLVKALASDIVLNLDYLIHEISATWMD